MTMKPLRALNWEAKPAQSSGGQSVTDNESVTPRDIARDEVKNAFLESLCHKGLVSIAAERAGVSRQTVYRWYREDPEFAKAWDQAIVVGLGRLEDVGMERAYTGSDTLLMFMLSNRLPDRYAAYSKRLSVSGTVNHTHSVEFGGRVSPAEDLKQIEAVAEVIREAAIPDAEVIESPAETQEKGQK